MKAPDAPQYPFTQVTPRMLPLIISIVLFATMGIVAGCTMQMLGESGQTLPAADAASDEAEPEATAAPAEEEAAAGADAQASSSRQGGGDDTTRLAELLQVQEARLAYNGEILAEKRVDVVPEVGGMAIEVLVQIGDNVQAGDILLQVDATTLEAAREQAMASLDSAQAQLELLQIEVNEDDLEAARANLAAAEAAYQRTLAGPTDEDLRIAQAALQQAEAGVTVARAAYNQVRGNPSIAALPQSLQLQQATLGLESAQAQYDKIVKGPTQEDIANAYAQVAQARANLTRLEEGPRGAQLRSAEASVRQAETSLYLAQRQLEKATVRAPIDGVVAQVYAVQGTTVGSSSPVVTLLSHDVKVVIPVEEYRLGELSIDQRAIIRVDAFPDRLFEGVVSMIAPELDSTTRSVQVTLRPISEGSTDLRPGMFATVDIFGEQE